MTSALQLCSPQLDCWWEEAGWCEADESSSGRQRAHPESTHPHCRNSEALQATYFCRECAIKSVPSPVTRVGCIP